MELSLKGKLAVICGSTQGIGLASAQLLARAGATCVLVARNEERLREVIRTLSVDHSQKHQFLLADFTQSDMLKSKIETFAQSHKAHILVNNTGGPAGGLITNAKTDEFVNAFNQHLICNHILVQALVPGMKENKYGRIINIISTSVKQPLKGLGVSNTIRAAVANWSKSMANELAGFGITVNNVLPGATNTQRLQSIIESKSHRSGEPNSHITNEMEVEIPMGRFAEAEEIASGVVFLASPAASYITGINLPIDGGRTACL
ncbi:MAG TPA: SDR family oxidoreductase [Bacteroidia bacterium]|nr:SDR family oxidoreductase [Bacteroidia bacterium]HNT80042.1 SDR family oxidoreductase [Bacteroidia bacterium]